jgi:hypothetical protein
MNKKERKRLTDLFTEKLINNTLSKYQYALWMTNFREQDARMFCKIYEETVKDIPFKLWIDGMFGMRA